MAQNVNQYYSNAGNAVKAQPAFQYVWDASAVITGVSPVTGAWRELTPSDFASIQVSGLSVTVTGIAELNTTTQNSNALLASISGTLTGLLGELEKKINATGTQNVAMVSGSVTSVAPIWSKTGSNAFVQSFTPFTTAKRVNKIMGTSKASYWPAYIQVFDGASQVGFPVSAVSVESGNNFFINFSEDGVLFNGGITIANSRDAIAIDTGNADFFVTVIYRD